MLMLTHMHIHTCTHTNTCTHTQMHTQGKNEQGNTQRFKVWTEFGPHRMSGAVVLPKIRSMLSYFILDESMIGDCQYVQSLMEKEQTILMEKTTNNTNK